MSTIFDSVHTSNGSLGPHYINKIRVTLTNVWRHKLLVIAMTAAGLVIGVALALMMPKRYTAEAYLRGGFTAEEATSSDRKNAGAIILDASMLVETRSRVLQSQLLARRVVQRLGLQRLRPVVSESPFSSWLRAKFYGDVAKAPEFQEDMAASKLMRGLSVKTEPRGYLIELSYTAGDPELAALITNAFLVEFLQTTAVQTLYHEREAAERNLSEKLATFGEKHPSVVDAKMQLQAVNALLRTQLAKTPEEIEHEAGENVAFAQANLVPSSSGPAVWIGVTLLVGLFGGIAAAAFWGRSTVKHLREFLSASTQAELPISR